MPLIFYNLLQWNLSKFLQFVKVVQPIIQKPKKKVLQMQFPHFLQFCVFFLHLKFGLINFFLSTGNMFNGPENRRKFHQRKCDKSYSKDPYFLCCQTLHNRIELHQDQYLFMHRLLNPHYEFPLCFLFSWPLFQKKAYEYYKCSCWKPWIPSQKELYCVELFLTHLFR